MYNSKPRRSYILRGFELVEQINVINEKILRLSNSVESKNTLDDGNIFQQPSTKTDGISSGKLTEEDSSNIVTRKGKLICDATACPQDIAYPTPQAGSRQQPGRSNAATAHYNAGLGYAGLGNLSPVSEYGLC